MLAAFHGKLTAEERRIADLRSQGQEWIDIAREMGGTPDARRKQLNRAIARVSIELRLDEPDDE